jgi:uncharacterized protein YsxB (DUF464 family)
MINAEIVRGKSGNVVGFKVENHGDSRVCAAISLLVQNTVNSLELLTEDDFYGQFNDVDKDWGYITFQFKDLENQSDGAKILLDAMALGLESTRDKYPAEVSIITRAVP